VLHGDGSPTRRYLYAGDAADAFDTILHKGQLGQVYNVGSYDEISNLELCSKLLTEIGIPHEGPEEFSKWVKYTHDRPFNDHRYAVDGTKLRKLGWDQKTSFADGLKITVNWYKQFGEQWWGDISKVLSPFPIVDGDTVMSDKEPVTDSPQPQEGQNLTKKRKVDGVNGANGTNGINGAASSYAVPA
jgi:dTDP-glucose 4,6-dehydratase